jgi:hypothetical protein
MWDFDSVLADLENRLSQETNWSRILFYGIIAALLRVVAYIISKLAYVAEVYYRESTWVNAQLIKSIADKSEFLSYTISRKKGASGFVQVAVESSFSSSYVYTGPGFNIPKWSQLTDANAANNVYVTTATVFQTNQTGPLDVAVKEGIPKEFTYIAKGLSNEEFSVFSSDIDNDEIEVFIVDTNGTVLNNVNIVGTGSNPDTLFFVNDTVNYYCEITNTNDFQSIKIKFGDGLTSRKLEVNQRVLVKYADTKGSLGNITTTGVITLFTEGNSFTDFNNNAQTVYVTNDNEISDGSDIEDLEYTKENAPRLFVAGYRAGGENDWTTILDNHSYIYKSLIEVNIDEAPETVFVTAISNDGNDLTADQKSEISLFMKDKKSPTEIIEWKDLNIIWTLFKVDATVINKPFSVISGEIYQALENNYGILNTEFQTDIFQSNYTCVIDDLDSVQHHRTDLFHLEKNAGQVSFNPIVTDHEILVGLSPTEQTDLEKQILLNPGSNELWLQRKSGTVWGSPFPIARDSAEDGTYSGLPGDLDSGVYQIGSSTIDYINNKISFTVDTLGNIPEYGIPNENYRLYIAYRTRDGNGNRVNDIRISTISGLITNIEAEYQQIDLEYA